MRRKVRLTESDLHKIVKESVQKILKEAVDGNLYSLRKRKVSKYVNETIDYDDYGSISNALVQCGWAYSDAYEVHNKNTGQQGVRYIIEPYPNNLEGIKPMEVEEMKQKMFELLGEENVIFSEGQHVNAPEIRNLSMVVVESD